MNKEKVFEKKMKSYVLNLDRCNQDCLFCMKKEDIKNFKTKNKKELFKEIDLAKKNNFKHIDFFGGEPTLFSYLPELIKYSLSLGLYPSLATNGTSFASKKYTKDFFNTIDNGAISIRISLHGEEKTVHDKITRVNDSFDKTILGVLEILKYTIPTITVVITSLNYSKLDIITKFVRKLGVSQIKFSGLEITGELLNNQWLLVKPTDYIKFLLKAILVAKKLKFTYVGVEKIPQKIMDELDKMKINWIVNET